MSQQQFNIETVAIKALSWIVGGVSCVAYAGAFGHPQFYTIRGREGDWRLEYPKDGGLFIDEGHTNQISARRAADADHCARIRNDLVNPAALVETSASCPLTNALEITGCKDEADLIGMANVGQSLEHAISELHKFPGYEHWSPADNPAEIVSDLCVEIEELRERMASLVPLVELFRDSLEFYIRCDETNGDDEGAHLKRHTLHLVEGAIGNSEGGAA